jgi:hypothetical protein
MQNLSTLTTPAEFIDFYYKQLKNDLNSSDLQISKVGALGYLLHILGNLQFDTKNYYNNLFNEAFPITSIENANLIQHSSLFGFNFDLAKESILQGTITFDMFMFSSIGRDIAKREIKFSNIEVLVDDMPFKIGAEYTIRALPTYNPQTGSIINKNWSLEIINIQGNRSIQPLEENNAVFPLINAIQYSTINYELTVPLYKYGSFYPVQIEIPSDQDISNINIRVQEVLNDFTEDFQVKHVKNFSTSNDPHIFYRIIEQQDGKKILLLELGNGTQGKYIPKSYIIVDIRTTYGEKGNIGAMILSSVQSDCVMIDYPKTTASSTDIVYTQIPNSNITLNISNGYGGTNILANEFLRDALIKFVQTRENLISSEDYFQILSNYFKYYVILFRKISLQENIINVYIPLMDKYFNPVYTLTYSIPKSEFIGNQVISNVDPFTNDVYVYINKPQVVINSKTFISPFIYRKTQYSDSYYSLAIQPDYYKYYSDLILVDYEAYLRSIRPQFIGLSTDNIISDPPNIYIETTVETRLKPGETNLSIFTIFNIKSSGDLSNYDIYIVISEFSFRVQTSPLQTADGFSHFIYEYEGIITVPITISLDLLEPVKFYEKVNGSDILNTITCNTYSLKFENFQYANDFGDILRVREYISDNQSHMLFVPMIDKLEYNKFPEFYSDQLISKLQNLQLSENRMITDDVQIRFLNSYYISNSDLKSLNNTEGFTIDGSDVTTQIFFPLKLLIHIIFDKVYLTQNKIDLIAHLDQIKLEVSKFLNTTHTGIKLEFYRSVVADILHTLFPSIKGVNIQLTDSANKNISTMLDYIIPNGNLSLIPSKNADTKLTKQNYLNYCPALYWWDLNNLNITYTLV